MAVAVEDLQILFKLFGRVTNASDLSTPVDEINKTYNTLFGNGTGANQANMLVHDQRTTDTTGEELDLAGGLTSPLSGAAVTFAVIKAVVVYASTANSGTVLITRPAANGVVLFVAAGDGLAGLKPGGLFAYIDPSAAGLTVTAGTGDLLKFAASTGTVTYDLWVLGEV
jgi:hypothetical protein